MRWDRKMPNRIIDRGKDEWRVMHSSEEVGGEGGGEGGGVPKCHSQALRRLN